MKTTIAHLKEILQENKDDLLDLLIVGVPTGILMIWINQSMDHSHLF